MADNIWANATIATDGEQQPIVQAQVPPIEPTAAPAPTETENIVASPVVIPEPLTPPVADATPPIITDWTVELEKASNGRIKDTQSLAAILEDYDRRQAEAERLKSEIDSTPTIAKKLAELTKNGATEADFKKFYAMQLLDTSTMTDLDKVRQQVKAKSVIALSDARVDILIENKYGSLDFDRMTDVGQILFEQDAHEAAAYINAQKVSAENPDSVKAKAEAAAAEQQYRTTMQNDFTTLYHSKAFTKLSVPLGAETFDYQLTEAQQQAVLNAAYYQMTANKLPFNDQRRADIISKNAFALYGPQITEAVHKNAAARAKQKTVEELSGTAATPSITTPPAQGGEKSIWQQIAEQRPA